MKDRRQRLGARLRTLRQARGMTQEQLAEHAGLHPTYIAKIELGSRLPSLEALERLAAALEVSMTAIVAAMDEDARLLPFAEEGKDKVAEEIQVLLEGCSKGQMDLLRNFVELIQRYDVRER